MNPVEVKPGNTNGTVIADTTATRPTNGKEFGALQMIEDTVISALSGNLLNISDLTGKTLPAGLIIYGRFTSVTLTSGTLLAYDL